MNPEIILGPPGCGKTTTLLGMVEDELAAGANPERIAYLSFTRRAAEEAVTRAMSRFGYDRNQFPFFRTLHSLCFRLTGVNSSDVLEGKKLQEFGDLVGYKITGKFSLEDGTIFGFEKGDRLLFMENLARVRGVPIRSLYDADDDDLSYWEVERFAKALAQFKADTGLMDFTDFLVKFLEEGFVPPLDVLLIDEAQDLSLLQWRVVQKLATRARRVIVAGDDDQAIYRWAGADVDAFVGMQGQVRVLSQSWRVPRRVQAVAADVVGRIQQRRPKEWQPRADDGGVRWLSSPDLADLSGEDVLILGRNRFYLREFERRIRSAGYLYEFQGARSIRPSLLDAVLTWERLRQGKSGVLGVHARRMYEQMSMGKGFKRGFKTLPQIADEDEINMQTLIDNGGLIANPSALWYDALDKMSLVDVAYLRAARRRGENLLQPPRIRLSTIHGMKGGEAKHVILLTDIAQRTYAEALRNRDDENRVWYVAVTRARQELSIVAPRTPKHFRL